MVNPGSRPIDIMLADSNPLVLSAMSEIFEKDPRFSLVATSATAEGFLGIVMRVPVQVGIIDWNLPVLGAAKLIEVLREHENAPRLVVYGDADGDAPRLAMQAGAAGFAPRSGEAEGLLETCLDVAAGKRVTARDNHAVGIVLRICDNLAVAGERRTQRVCPIPVRFH